MQIKDFEDLLVEDWTWRKKEVSDLILLAEKEENTVLLKSIILLLYAHWEGYIKKSSKTYLKYICDNKHKLNELTDNFKAVALKGLTGEVMKSGNTLSLQNELHYIKKFSDLDNISIDHHIKIDLDNEKDKNIINTHDNLNPEIFGNILKIIGIDYKEQYDAKEIFINTYLLSNRNSIGHGSKELFKDENFEFKISSMKRLRDVILVIVENFRDELIEFAHNSLYLKVNKEKAKQSKQKFETQLKDDFSEIDKAYN
ncbi:MAE_28990/MAE_18760 family HEPN-like nuclease [Flavobacterium sp. UBA4197]|uniref:MAE_28990/MAE_18760 family HEPN-like nuclease n=1 Tax=Flavobacterium sp. UBA4197 TaxID=1946546 RepID=UPI00257CB05B|nr:MAE_28990/MAE_18760 family HEPN-like nuclease [Flavobacterium sp. UBA4197]